MVVLLDTKFFTKEAGVEVGAALKRGRQASLATVAARMNLGTRQHTSRHRLARPTPTDTHHQPGIIANTKIPRR